MLKQERKHLYSNYLVRWPAKLPGILVANFDLKEDKAKWLSEEPSDNVTLEHYLKTCRSYMAKDSEQVWFGRPDQIHIDWWDQGDMMGKKSTVCGQSFKRPFAATSQSAASGSSSSMAASHPVVPGAELKVFAGWGG